MEEFLRAHRKISVRLGCPHFGETPQKQTQRGEFLCKRLPKKEVVTKRGQQDRERKGKQECSFHHVSGRGVAA